MEAPHFLHRYMNSFHLSVGVQWELARLISLGIVHGDDIEISNLECLKGTNVYAAPLVASGLLAKEIEPEPTQFKKAFERERVATVF